MIRRLTTGNRGVASLATIMILSAVVIEIALVGFALTTFLSSANYGLRLSSRSLSAAYAGIDDATLRIIRDDYIHDVSYAITDASGTTVTVTICTGGLVIPAGSACSSEVATWSTSKRQVISSGVAPPKKERLTAVFELDPATGVAKLESITE